MHRFSHRAMGSLFEILLPGGDAQVAKDAAESAFEELDRVEKRLTRFDPHSEVSRINAAPVGRQVVLDVDAFECLRLARRVWSDTGGAFDVTAGKPAAGEGAAPRRVGMQFLALDEDALAVRRLDPGVQVDLGGIGKGYGLDRMAEVLREWEIGTALLHGGQSTVLAMGSRGESGWRLALRDPADADAAPLGWVSLSDRAFSGSSTAAARHITDPRTGLAVPGNRAAWAVTRSAAAADALTTALCVMSEAEARRLSEKRKDLPFLVATRRDGAWQLRPFGPPMLAAVRTCR